jgi:hypothetical protein
MWTCVKPVWNSLIVNCITDSCIWYTGVTWQGIDCKLSGDDTIVSKHVGSVIICEIIAHLLVIVQNKGKILVQTFHFEHTMTLRLAHWLPSFIVTCLPIDTLLVTATIVNSALVDVSTFKSRATHHFQSQAWCTSIVLQKHRTKHTSCSKIHVTRVITIML